MAGTSNFVLRSEISNENNKITTGNATSVESNDGRVQWYLLPPPPAMRRGLFACRLCTCIGLLLLIAGACSIVVGYTWPHDSIEQAMHHVSAYQDEEGTYYIPTIEKREYVMRNPMKAWKTAGFCIYSAGAILLALSLLVPTVAQFEESICLVSLQRTIHPTSLQSESSPDNLDLVVRSPSPKRSRRSSHPETPRTSDRPPTIYSRTDQQATPILAPPPC